ncbi:MAG TPA: MFS transporter [Caulobacteraceae bacterium]|nr:MFS transporter [Caulobacteraceae bacterium]
MTRRRPGVLAALGRPKAAQMLALGFASGLPFMLIGNTLGYWLAQDHVRLAAIGFVSWIGLTYGVKFVYGAVVDRLPAPLVGRLGRRRGWMLLSQIGVAVGLLGMAASDPVRHFGWLVATALVTGVCAATQDTAIDALRIEMAADADELSLLTSANSIGFRVALVATEAWIFGLANFIGWPASYQVFAGLMIVGPIATFFVREPARADAAMQARDAQTRRHPLLGAWDAVAGPIAAFVRAHGAAAAILMLALITTYHLSDFMRGPMVNPSYLAFRIPMLTIMGVRTTLGIAASFAGIALGGLSAARLGIRPTLIIGALVQPVAVAAFALIGWHGGDWTVFSLGRLQVTAFELVMVFDGLAMSYAGIGLAVYMSTLTSLGYTATQYALLTSALVWFGKSLKGWSGAIVESLNHAQNLTAAYAEFYLLAAAVGAPAIVLSLALAGRRAPHGAPG